MVARLWTDLWVCRFCDWTDQRLRRITRHVWCTDATWNDRTNKRIVTVLGLTFWEIRALHFWSDNDIYFVSGRYGCSSVAAADAVADVAAAAGPAFVACYHCHLPRSSYKHGASLKAPYPLRIYHSRFFNTEWRRTMFRFWLYFRICGGVLSGRNSLASSFLFSPWNV